MKKEIENKCMLEQVEEMFSRAIDALTIPAECVLETSVDWYPLLKRGVYDCTVVLAKGTSLRRFNIEMFELELKDDCTISNFGAWIEYGDKGLTLRIKVIDSWNDELL